MSSSLHEGQVCGRWTLIACDPAQTCRPSSLRWLCQCKCGTTKEVLSYSLKKGLSQSCGCLSKELTRQRGIKHGMTRTPEYHAWRNMKYRCCNPNHPEYKRYGARGILVCERWMNSFQDFIDDMGARPGDQYSIDRVDNNGNYEPGNCRWTTLKQQNRNTRKNVKVVYCGREMCIAEAAELSGIKPKTLWSRINLGFSGEDLFRKASSLPR